MSIRIAHGAGPVSCRVINMGGVKEQRFLERHARQFGRLRECGRDYLTLEWARVEAFGRVAGEAGIEIIR